MIDVFFFFFKQKTAYEITYGDWSSDVCSSDLAIDLNRHCRSDEPPYLCRELSMNDIVCRILSCSTIRFFTNLHACNTVPWSRPPKASPISFKDALVSSRARYIATCRGKAMLAGRRLLVISATRTSNCSATRR